MHGDLARGSRPRRHAGARAFAFAIVAAVLCLVADPSVAMAALVAAGEPGPEGGALFSPAPAVSSCPEEEAQPAALPPEPMCEVVAIDPDEDGFFAAAPICDPSGASAVAPPPVHPIGDDRLEATPSCGEPLGGDELDRDRSGDSPIERPLTAIDPALLPSAEPPLRARGASCLENPAVLLGPAEGFRNRLEHPPTAG